MPKSSVRKNSSASVLVSKRMQIGIETDNRQIIDVRLKTYLMILTPSGRLRNPGNNGLIRYTKTPGNSNLFGS